MAKLNAYLTKYSRLRGSDLHSTDADALADGLYFTMHNFADDADYVLVGDAEVTVTLMPRADVVGTQIASLRAQQKKLMADAQAASVELSRQINSLLAIEGAATEVVA